MGWWRAERVACGPADCITFKISTVMLMVMVMVVINNIRFMCLVIKAIFYWTRKV